MDPSLTLNAIAAPQCQPRQASRSQSPILYLCRSGLGGGPRSVVAALFWLCAGLPTPHDNRPKVSPKSQPAACSHNATSKNRSKFRPKIHHFPPQNTLPVGSFWKTNPPKKRLPPPHNPLPSKYINTHFHFKIGGFVW